MDPSPLDSIDMNRFWSPTSSTSAIADSPPADQSPRDEEAPTIPVVNLQDYYNLNTREGFIADLKEALRTVGFVAVRNPGVEIATLNNGYAAAEKFFRQDIEEKRKLSNPSNNGQRGYVESESAKNQSDKDIKEFFHVGREVASSSQHVLEAKNLWPDDFDLKTPMVNLFNALEDHMLPMSRAISEAIGEEQDFLSNMTYDGECLLRALHYPANPPVNGTWAAEHTDINLFTILPRSTAEGLQVQGQGGRWIDVVVPEDSFIINAGDMLQNMTNGLVRSAVHRVKDTGRGEERYSMVFFVHPRSNDRMDPLADCIAETGGRQLYPDATRWELLCERLVDLGLASEDMIQFLGNCGVIDRFIDHGKHSDKVLRVLRDHQCASQKVLDVLSRQEASSLPLESS